MTVVVYLGFSCRSTILILDSSIIKHLGHGYGTTWEVGIVVQTLTNLGCKSTSFFKVDYMIVKGMVSKATRQIKVSWLRLIT
jgi:hypothetical protein